MKFDSLHVGRTYYTVSKGKMGNTTISTVSVCPVTVISIDSVKETVEASWNGSAPKTFRACQYRTWRLSKPMTIRSALGSVRLATRAEIAASKTTD